MVTKRIFIRPALLPSTPQSIAVKIGFDEVEARRIFAGSDFTLMPSRFEPCGPSPGFLGSLCRALSSFGMKDRLDHMRRATMAQALSWTDSAKAYAALYKATV